MLFLYDTKHGSTEKLLLNITGAIEELSPDLTVDKVKKKFSDVDLNKYKNIFIISPVYFGSPLNTILRFLKKKYAELENKKVSIITSGMSSSDLNKCKNKNWFKYEGEDKEKMIKKYNELTKIDRDLLKKYNFYYIKGMCDVDSLSEYEKKVCILSGSDFSKFNQKEFSEKEINEHKEFGKQLSLELGGKDELF